ncbi:MAG: Trp biosynthesis-associated membrane protein, partial [Nocardioidaceae bacterium]|nr:Trp biosynthesis-associated membrane protein [Nocardioidaceae bacterium]
MTDHERLSRWRGTQGYAATLITGLLAAISVTVAATRPWVTATAVQPNLPTLDVAVEGTDLSPPAGAMGLVMLAAFGAVVATRGRVRQILGVVIVASAGLVLFLAISPGDESQAVRAALS